MMKKRIFAVLLIVVLCLSFCSCNYIDEMRATQFYWGNEAQTVLVSRNGTEYKKVPNEKMLNLNISNKSYNGRILDDPAVPLLIASGNMVYTDPEINYIGGYIDGDKEFDLFCRPEKFDDAVDFINRKSESIYGYEYYDVSEYKYKYREFSSEEQGLIDNIFKSVSPKTVPKAEFDTEEYIRVDRFNQDRTISLLSYYIERKGQTYYVVIYENSQAIFRAVPAEHVEIIKYMLKEHTNY